MVHLLTYIPLRKSRAEQTSSLCAQYSWYSECGLVAVIKLWLGLHAGNFTIHVIWLGLSHNLSCSICVQTWALGEVHTLIRHEPVYVLHNVICTTV